MLSFQSLVFSWPTAKQHNFGRNICGHGWFSSSLIRLFVRFKLETSVWSSLMSIFQIYCISGNKHIKKNKISKRLIKPQLHPHVLSALPLSRSSICAQNKLNSTLRRSCGRDYFSNRFYFSVSVSRLILSLQLCSNTSAPRRPQGFLAGCIMLSPVTCL